MLFLTMIHSKLILRKSLSPSDLMRTKALYIYELTQVIIFSKNKNLIFENFYKVVLSLKNFNNGLKYLIINCVLCFC